MFPVAIPKTSNGSKFGFTEIPPDCGSIDELSAFTLPTVCCSNSNATLALNSFCRFFALILAKLESCDKGPSEPVGLSCNKMLYGVYVDGKNIKVLSEFAYGSCNI